MRPTKNDILKKAGILAATIMLALAAGSCGSDVSVAPPDPPINRAPSVPTIDTTAGAPADGASSVPLTTTLYWSCSDPDGDSLTYDFHLGSTDTPPVVSTDMTEASYGPLSMVGGATFYWQVVAKDPGGETTASPVWSFTTLDDNAETISAPVIPIGAATPTIDVESSYTTSGATSSDGHAVEYQFNWGDGTSSDWAAAASANHTWSAAGTFSVTTQARCAEHTNVFSSLSGALTVTVEGPENISTPNSADGPLAGESGETLSYNLSGATSSRGHTVEYRVEWEDGVVSAWAALTGSRSHVWAVAGTYNVRVQARCLDHPDVESSWSTAISVAISDLAETISGAQIQSGPVVGGIEDVLEFRSYAMTSSLGHLLEYRYDWNDGTYSEWAAQTSWNPGTHTWSTEGSYQVRVMARCIEHPASESEWSGAHEVAIFAGEVVTAPTLQPMEDQTIDVMQWITFSVPLGGTSNLGHALEYQFDPGDGRTLSWESFSTTVRYSTLGDFDARVRVRCFEHPDIVSDWSTVTVIHVAELESISTPTLSGPPVGTSGVPVQFTISGAVSTYGDGLEYQLLWSRNGSFQPATIMDWASADSLSVTWDAPEPYLYVLVNTRCAVHPDVTANQSNVVQLLVEE